MNTEKTNRTQAIIVACVLAYLLGTVIAFGHAVNNCAMPKTYAGADHPAAFGLKCFFPLPLGPGICRPLRSGPLNP